MPPACRRHELGHIRLHQVALWYQLVLCYSQLIPILGPTLSRLREYSCDRNGAVVEPNGEPVRSRGHPHPPPAAPRSRSGVTRPGPAGR